MLRILENLSHHKRTAPYIDKIIILRLVFGNAIIDYEDRATRIIISGCIVFIRR